MRVAIASDIHGNRHAFEAVIAAAEAAERRGAVVPRRPRRLRRRARRLRRAGRGEHCAICLAGNHDLAVVDVLSLEDFSRGAALAAHWTQEIDRARDARVPALAVARRAAREGVGLYHASPRDPIWEYVLSGLTAELCLDATDYRVSLIGHSHVALSFHRPEGEPATGLDAPRGRPSSTSPTGEWLINPGCAGQPRDGDPRAAWLLLDTERLDGATGGARSTTSRARRRRSARRGCPTRSPSACSTVSEPRVLPIARRLGARRSPPPCSLPAAAARTRS